MPSAELRLPGVPGARLVWPPAKPTATLVVLAEEQGEPLCRELARRCGVLALCVPCRGPQDGTAALEWTADHAVQLGAAGPLKLTGVGAGAGYAQAVAARAREQGWPAVELVQPRADLPPA